jgi:putative ABC transport system permease protein
MMSFREEILKNPSVMSTTVSGFLPIPSNRNNSSIFPDAILTENLFNCQNWTVDHDYIKTFGLNIIDGRDFSLDYPTDSLALIFNEAAVKSLGWENPVGRVMGIPKDYAAAGNLELDRYTVIGVVEDFHYESMHRPIEPMVMFLGNSTSRVSIRLNANSDVSSLLKDMEKLWNDYVPGQPFSYTFIDQRLAMMYENEQKLGKLLGIFTLFAFFVSCLGLIGLALFASEQRRKEIGLRKVNGSGIGQIIWLLTTDFTKLIVISFILSIPLTTIFMSKWLSGFAYKTSIAWWIFAATGLLTYMVAMVAIISQSYRAATTNPVDVFRAE